MASEYEVIWYLADGTRCRAFTPSKGDAIERAKKKPGAYVKLWGPGSIVYQQSAPAMLDALQMMVRAFNTADVDPLVAFSTIEKARAAIDAAREN